MAITTDKTFLKCGRDEGRCSAFMKPSWFRGEPVQCFSRPTVTRDGKPYCGTHDPVAIAERAAAREEKKITRERGAIK